MELSIWLLFSSIALASIICHSPAVLLAVTNGRRQGLKGSIFSSLGNICGIFIISIAAILGLGAMLETSALLFAILKLSGAIYLLWLGIRQWRSKRQLFEIQDKSTEHPHGERKYFIQGLLVALSNPKAILFFTALFPQFIDISRPVVIQFVILTLTFMSYSFLTLMIYAKSAHFFKGRLFAGNRNLWVNRISGTIFIIFGLGILGIRNKTA